MIDHLGDGLRPERIERALRNRAAAFNYDADLERLIALEAKGEAPHIDPTTRMSIGSYKLMRKAAEAAGADVSNPVETETDRSYADAYRAIATPATYSSYTL